MREGQVESDELERIKHESSMMKHYLMSEKRNDDVLSWEVIREMVGYERKTSVTKIDVNRLVKNRMDHYQEKKMRLWR